MSITDEKLRDTKYIKKEQLLILQNIRKISFVINSTVFQKHITYVIIGIMQFKI